MSSPSGDGDEQQEADAGIGRGVFAGLAPRTQGYYIGSLATFALAVLGVAIEARYALLGLDDGVLSVFISATALGLVASFWVFLVIR